jgi:hypothetical protein
MQAAETPIPMSEVAMGSHHDEIAVKVPKVATWVLASTYVLHENRRYRS